MSRFVQSFNPPIMNKPVDIMEWHWHAQALTVLYGSVPADDLTRMLPIMVRPAMIANAESLYDRNVAVEISDDAQCNSNDCNMWLYSPTAMASALQIFGMLPTGEITWTARVHLRGKPVRSRAGELSRPGAAGEIFSITWDFVKTFVGITRI